MTATSPAAPPSSGPPSRPSANGRRRSPRGQGDRLRQELVEAAGRLLEAVPDESAMSLRAVAREAGVAAPSVYLHFADKRELVLAVLADRFAQLGRRLEEAVAGEDDAYARLRALCLAYCDAAAESPGHYRVMFGARPAPASAPEPSLPGAHLIELVAGLVAACGHDAEPRRTALLLWSSLHGLVTLRETRPAVGWPERDGLVEDLLRALVPR